MDNINKLVDKLMKWKESYYNGNPEISDEEFDFEERKLKKLDPNNEYFRKVGFNVGSRDIKVEHEVPMLSMQKVQTAEDADKWMKDIYNIPGLSFSTMKYGIWVDPKIDGISGKIVYDSNGNFKYASTRGNGKIGAIIQFGDKIKTVPKKFIPNSELRGEFFVSKRNKSHFNGPLRNIAAGLLKRKEFDDDASFIEFIIYDIHTYSKSNEIVFKDRLDKLNKIKQILDDNGTQYYRIVPVEKTDNIEELYAKYNKILRNQWDFETDGIVMTVDGGQDNYNLINSKYIITSFNRFNMALKPPAECAESVVNGINVYVNRQKLSFVASIKPIYINGVLVSAATLDNYTLMHEKQIGIGSRVLIKRSNDVIPKIIEAYNDVDVKVKPIELKECPCCKKPLTLIDRNLVCVNEFGCKDIYESKLNFMINGLNIMNIGPAIVNKIVEKMINDNRDLTFNNFFNIIINDKLRYEYFINATNSEKVTRTISNSIDTVLNNGISELQLIGHFNIPAIGEKQLISHKIFTLNDLFEYCKKIEKSPIMSVFDIKLLNWVKDQNHVNDIISSINILKNYIKNEQIDDNNCKHYCISGEIGGNFKNKKDFIQYVSSINPDYKFVDSVKRGIDFLVSEEDGTVKVLKAKQYGIPIYTPEKALEIINKK